MAYNNSRAPSVRNEQWRVEKSANLTPVEPSGKLCRNVPTSTKPKCSNYMRASNYTYLLKDSALNVHRYLLVGQV